jgi:protein-S-isoprenylcysteine O-methyltransferase Ste14
MMRGVSFTFRAIIALCWITFYVVWSVAALFTKRTAERTAWRRGWWIWFPVAGVMFLARRAILFSVGAVLWQVTPLLGIASDAITVIGLLITLWARRMLGTNWSASVVFKERHELIEGGPYRFVRHPIYSGVLLMLLGTMLLWGRLVGVVAFVAIMVGLSVKASLEERLLMKHFPDAYAGYRRQVRAAIIPFVI